MKDLLFLTARIKQPSVALCFMLVIGLCLILGIQPISFIPYYFSNFNGAEAQEETQQPPSQVNNEGSTSSPQILGQDLENLIRPYVGYITFAIDVSAGIIIGISAIMGLISFLKILRKPVEQQTHDKETIRLRLARGMLLALDFEVGSDILKTILVPSITELTILAVVVGIRIVLSWSLSKEIGRHADIKEADQRRREGAFQTTTMSNESNARNYNNDDNIASEPSAGTEGQRSKQKDRDELSSSSSSSSSRISEE